MAARIIINTSLRKHGSARCVPLALGLGHRAGGRMKRKVASAADCLSSTTTGCPVRLFSKPVLFRTLGRPLLPTLDKYGLPVLPRDQRIYLPTEEEKTIEWLNNRTARLKARTDKLVKSQLW